MDMSRKPSIMHGIPLTFSREEVAECFDRKNDFSRERFHLGRLRQLQAEKALQATLRIAHDLNVRLPEEVHHHATLTHFSLVKARRTHWGYYLLTIEYVYQGTRWQQVFRFERDSRGGLSGILYFNSRRRMVA